MHLQAKVHPVTFPYKRFQLHGWGLKSLTVALIFLVCKLSLYIHISGWHEFASVFIYHKPHLFL